MGDFILSLPVIDNLREQYPQAQIDILVRPYIKDLAALSKNISNVLVCVNKISAMFELRRQRYDIAIDLLCDYRLDSALLAFMSAAPLRLGFSGGFRQILFTHLIYPENFPEKSAVELNLKLIGLLGIYGHVARPFLGIEKKQQSNERLIAIHPGGYFPSQRWKPQKFISLAKDILKAFDAKMLVVGAESERDLVKQIVKGIADGRVREEFPGINDLAFCLSKADLLICNNSGPLHLACALGLPTVSFMGPTDHVRFWPKGEHNIVLRKGLKCSPCSRAFCKKHDCLELITVDEAFDAVKKILEEVYGIKECQQDTYH
jgi:heptosyltransferase-2